MRSDRAARHIDAISRKSPQFAGSDFLGDYGDLAVLFDKAASRKVNLKPEYAGFAAASKEWVGYGLCGGDGLYGNLGFVGAAPGARVAKRRGTSSRASKKHVSRGRGKT